MIPPAVAILSALLKQDNHEIRLFDSTYWEFPECKDVDRDGERERHLQIPPCRDEQKPVPSYTTDVYDELNTVVAEFEPDLIAASATEDLFPYGIKLLENLRDKGKAKTIFGGVFPTFAPDRVIGHPGVDMICLGEGEYPLLELCKRLEKGQSYTDIPNLWVKQDGVIFKNPVTSLTDMDGLPLMDLEIFDDSRFYRPFGGKICRTIPVDSHRGCPYHCAYCNSPGVKRIYKAEDMHFSRQKSIENARRELLYYKNHWRAEYLYFLADTFLALPNRYLEEFAEMYASEINLPFWCQTRPETLTEKRVTLLKKMGIHRIGMGVEHGNPQFREKLLNRKTKNRAIIESIRRLEHHDITYAINSMIGFPMETRELAFDTIRLNKEFSPEGRNMSIYVPYRGAPMRDMAEKMGYIDPDTIVTFWTRFSHLDMPQFSKESIEGVRRCFVPYVLLEKDRWPEIEQAEKLTPEGDKIWGKIRAHFLVGGRNFIKEDRVESLVNPCQS
uniref:Radical SAM superfamily enzyme YgiQ, UPF0313 family n=1 Tax=Candidatus Kentrum sp. DK TaxID=2126562 RepID=A0A450TBL7_9GAMM|nr:MAG: Radical SAM superfamily enzyme YgiQ, UPF0313 family [Candidatus Kentron sp. DK]